MNITRFIATWASGSWLALAGITVLVWGGAPDPFSMDKVLRMHSAMWLLLGPVLTWIGMWIAYREGQRSVKGVSK